MKIKLMTLLLSISILSDTQLYAQKTDTAQYITTKLTIPQLNRQRTVKIYLPPGYALSNRKYPVIYMQDGQGIFIKNAKDKDNWYADSLMNTFPAKKQAIIVAIYSGPGKNRMSEYNPYNGYNNKGEGKEYAAYIVQVVKPYIDQNYRTITDAKHSVLVGSSMGGLITLYTAAKYPDVFGVSGIFSPAFWFAPGIYDEVANQTINPKAKFFMACGDAEGNEIVFVNRMDSILRSKKINPKNIPPTLIIKGGKHDERQWRIAFDVFYKWFANQP